MILIYIENKHLLTKIVTYFDQAKINYTTDLNRKYDILVIGELNNKIINFFKKGCLDNKKIIFVTYLEENKIFINYKLQNKSSKKYQKRLYGILDKCHRIITSSDFIKNILKKEIKNNIEVIPKELPIINISRTNKDIYLKYQISKYKKKIIVIDLNYNNLSKIQELAIKYPKYNYLYIGFKPDYLLTDKNKNILYTLPSNITQIKKLDLNIYSDIAKISTLVINFEDIDLRSEYILITLFFKKQLLVKDSILYEDYFTDNKNVYLFKNKDELFLKFKKIVTGRLANLSNNGYDLVKNHEEGEIIKKYEAYFR